MAYDGLIAIYSGRHLKHQYDMLRACRGCLNHITRNTGVAFTFGLPVTDLHRALLWKAHNKVYPQRRRWFDEGRQSWISFPSWTWAGWQGRAEYDYWTVDMVGYIDYKPEDKTKILSREGRARRRRNE
jgi:hypothetical protein